MGEQDEWQGMKGEGTRSKKPRRREGRGNGRTWRAGEGRAYI